MPFGSTIGYLRDRCLNKIMDLRKKRCNGPEDQFSHSAPFQVSNQKSKFLHDFKIKVEINKDFQISNEERNCFLFQIGTIGSPAGFHCSWCFEPEGIAIKLLSAIHQV